VMMGISSMSSNTFEICMLLKFKKLAMILVAFNLL